MVYAPPLEKRFTPVKDGQQYEQKSTKFVYFLSMLCAVSGFLLGYDTGIVSGSMVFVREHFHLSILWHELIVAVTIFAASIFAGVSGYVTDRWGRKPVIVVSGLIFTPGALLCGLATGKEMLLFGRLILGIAIGLSSMTIPIYVAEVSPIHIRGRLVVINQIFIFFGQFLSGLIAAIMASTIDESVSWRWMLGIAGIPSLFQFFGFLVMPESPRWLIKRGRDSEAKKVLIRLRGKKGANVEFDAIKADCEEDRRKDDKHKKLIFKQILNDQNTRKALLVGCLIWVVHQFSGVNTIMYYCATILQMSGIYDKQRLVWLATIPAAVSAFTSLSVMYLVEKAGRRKLTLFSLTGVIACLVLIAIGFQLADKDAAKVIVEYEIPEINGTSCSGQSSCFDCVSTGDCGFCFELNAENLVNGTCLPVNRDNNEQSSIGKCMTGTLGNHQVWATDFCPPKSFSWMTLIGTTLYLFFFSLGMAPMPWTINSEIYPLWARSTCQSTSMAINWFSNFIVSLTFLSLTHAITKYGTFYFYASIAFIGFIYFYFVLPETKGLSLEEIDTLFLSEKKKKEKNNNVIITRF